jgi:hypothetical protein
MTTADKPFHEHQAALLDSQRHVNRAPMALNGCGFETVDEVTPSRRIGWMIWPALVLGFAVVIGIASI